MSAQGTFGYLIVGMFMPVGDTAVLFEAWGFSSLGYIAAGLVGLAGMLFLSYLLSREILRTVSDPGDVVAASVLTWLVATGVLAVVYVSAALIVGYHAEYLCRPSSARRRRSSSPPWPPSGGGRSPTCTSRGATAPRWCR